jgi:hypothetical protein
MFKVVIETDSAAFDYDAAGEVARILRRLADGKLDELGPGRPRKTDSGSLRDSNGNRVGAWTWEGGEQ